MSVIGLDTVFEGTITLKGNLRIDGTFIGNVDTPGHILLTNSGTLDGNVICETVSVSGIVRGDVTARKVTISRTGRVLGDLRVESLATEEGSYVQGKILLETGIRVGDVIRDSNHQLESVEENQRPDTQTIKVGRKL